ncbi:MAG TPA: GNAT family N-acetyltransferase [Polyangiaceae bacterium]|nr:GNAT family N-acetyltransferase [Polyangiaceae bacterium]
MPDLRSRIAREADVPLLLAMMESFNLLEGIDWDVHAKEPALRTLLRERELGLVALLEGPDGPFGYYVLTWGYDLEWNGRDAFLTELFLVPSARGKGNGAHALELLESLARKHGARALHLMVRHENIVARRLYMGHGYRSPERLFLSKEL